MKKIAIIISLGFIILLPQQVAATSGACSDHGGVNCSAGAGVYGQAICNDGWDGSSVSYDSMVECHGGFVCPNPFTQTQSDNAKQEFATADAKQNELLSNLDQINNGTFPLNPSQQSQIDDANTNYNALVQQTIDTYNSNHIPIDQGFLNNLSVQHNGLIGQLKSGFYAFDFSGTKTLLDMLRPDWNRKMQLAGCPVKTGLLQTPKVPVDTSSSINEIKKTLVCDAGYELATNGQCITYNDSCHAQLGLNSHGDGTTCYCSDNYWIGANNQCVLWNQICTDNYGPNIHAEGKQCICNAGYFYDDSLKICKILKVTSSLKAQAQTPQIQKPKLKKPALVTPAASSTRFIEQRAGDTTTANLSGTTTDWSKYSSTLALETKPVEPLKESVLKRMWKKFLSWF